MVHVSCSHCDRNQNGGHPRFCVAADRRGPAVTGRVGRLSIPRAVSGEEVRGMNHAEEARSSQLDTVQTSRYRVRLPGFITDGDVGLGDVIKRVTYAVGLKLCGGCERRAAALNQ